jgi:hypothetical protein
MLDLFEVNNVGFGDLLQGKDLLRWAQDQFYTPKGSRSEGLGYLVFGDVCWIAILGACTFGFGGIAIWFCLEGRANFFPFPLLLQLL